MRPGSYYQQPAQRGPADRSTDSLPKGVPARRRSAWLKHRNSNKKVRWDRSVIDNEKTPKVPSVRPPTPPLNKRPSKLSKGLAYPSSSQKPSASTTAGSGTAANNSGKMYSPSPQRPRGSRASSLLDHNPRSRHGDHVTATGTRPSPTKAKSTLQKMPKPGNRLNLTLGVASTKPTQQSKSQRPAGVPPAVPDAPPSRTKGPPPTPRITRLATPDLPEVSRNQFCNCGGKICNKPIHVNVGADDDCCGSTHYKWSSNFKMDAQSKKSSGQPS
jgi:hypothetical protein